MSLAGPTIPMMMTRNGQTRMMICHLGLRLRDVRRRRRPTSTTEPDPEETEEPEPPAATPTGVDTFANATIYQPDDTTHHLTSPRTENLPNSTVLAVWNDPAQANGTLAIIVRRITASHCTHTAL